jgi:chorismate mutase
MMSEKLKLVRPVLSKTNERPIIISGPCSAESEEQVLSTARELAAMGIGVFRAGIWKPRTRPNSFEGMGSAALPWLQKVKEETGMLTTTEVANVWHVKECLRHGIDILWIGARTSANPFIMQEIADSLRGLDVIVFVKNPVNPDIDLWIGALERLNKAGITKLAAVHRGFSVYGQNDFRNPPMWEIPIELKTRIPDLPIITDPSHICGKRETLFGVAQRAMDLNFDGLFIESHINPEVALSDKNQQITPAELKNLLSRLIVRNTDPVGEAQIENLEGLRRQIDQWDDEILRTIGSRMKISEQIGRYKKEQSITILQPNRWNEIIEDRLKKGLEQGLSEEFIIKLFKEIHQESISRQTKVMNE